MQSDEGALVASEPDRPDAVQAAQSPESVEPSAPAAQSVADEREPPTPPHASADDDEPLVVALPLVEVSPDVITQGEAFALTVEGEQAAAVTAVATVGGRSWNLRPSAHGVSSAMGVWWGIIAIPRDAATGLVDVVVDLFDEHGWLQARTVQVLVLANAAPLEEITLGSDNGAPVDPEELQRDVDVRFVHHVAVTGLPRWDGPWQLPVVGEVSGLFGARRSYDGVLSSEWHHGHDIAAMHGDPIAAPAAGVVVWSGELILHGMGVILDHGAGVYSGYWHMSLIAVGEGMEVAAGDWLGNVGTTGLSTGPHLHWEVIVQGIDVDPVQWLGETQPPTPSLAESVGAESADTLD